jgi:hypothetical protein
MARFNGPIRKAVLVSNTGADENAHLKNPLLRLVPKICSISWGDLAEIRSLTAQEEYQKRE